MYWKGEVPHIWEVDEFDEDVEAIKQVICNTGYLSSGVSLFSEKWNDNAASRPKSGPIEKTKKAAKPQPIVRVKTPRPVVDFVAYKLHREKLLRDHASVMDFLRVAQERAEEAERLRAQKQKEQAKRDKAEKAIRERNDFVLRELYLNQEIIGRKWALEQIVQLVPAIKALKAQSETWQAEQLEGRISQLRSTYHI